MNLSVFENKYVMVTGATGLIGKNIIFKLLEYNNKLSDGYIKVLAVVRNIDKAKRIFGDESDSLKFIIGDIKSVNLSGYKADFIIHAASETSSKSFVEFPVETISTAFDGTRNMLEYAKQQNVERFIYLSTMEVYGTPETDEKINEDHPTNLSTMNVRSCYAEVKRMCENMCISYASEYNIPVNVLRLTQTFGPGVEYNDGRVFAEFARCVIENKDIVLKTKGETKRSYIHVMDAVNAILTVIISGQKNQAYNVANEDTYCSIYEMATFVAKEIANGNIQVVIDESGVEKRGFAPTLHMNLDTSKLKKAGWSADHDLRSMFVDMINSMKK